MGPEVSEQFSEYISGVTLCSQRVFQDALNGPNKDIFASIVNSRIPLPRKSVESLEEVLRESVGSAAGASHPLHAYCNKALALGSTLETKMKAMSTKEFEQVLHPIFQEDEMILILAGAVLGAAAGGLQLWQNDRIDRWVNKLYAKFQKWRTNRAERRASTEGTSNPSTEQSPDTGVE